MAHPDYYETLGVPASASQEEIRGAHRELVKRYHPDIYSTSGDKARATEKLQAINEAYSVVGNPERRRTYDLDRVRPPPIQRRPATAKRAATRPPRPSPRPKAPTPPPVRARKKFEWKKRFFTVPWLAGSLGGVALFVVVAYSFNHEPRILPLWVLVQKTEFEPAPTGSVAGAAEWERLSSFSSSEECAEDLKGRLKLDKAEGSHAVFDEARGTMAIAVLLIKKTSPADARDKDDAAPSDEGGVANATGSGSQDSFIKRTRYYECRVSQVQQSESWWRRKLRGIGFFS